MGTQVNKLILQTLIVALSVGVSCAEVIFEDNFESHDDWFIDRENMGSSVKWTDTVGLPDDPWPSANPTSGPRYIGYNKSISYIDNAQHNTVNFNSDNARGGAGKGVTYWVEVPEGEGTFDASDGVMYTTLTDTPGDYGYDEIWVQVWRKYQPEFYTRQSGHKYIHASHYTGVPEFLNDWHPSGEGDDRAHHPAIVGGTTGYDYTDSTGNYRRQQYMLMRMYPFENREDYNSGAPPPTECGQTSGSNHSGTTYTESMLYTTGTREGGWQNEGNYGDGDWHYHEYHLKMNSDVGEEDGVYEYYIDGECQVRHTDVPWAVTGEMVGWNLVALGGNNDYEYGGAGGSEIYYAYDDYVISTTRVGRDYVIGEPLGDQIYSDGASIITGD